ncbi:MAG: hypothetical protein NTZ74_03955 [Chloroflexi bacterium]|nr:hypothetical protein [Chloroflexota bacterium]
MKLSYVWDYNIDENQFKDILAGRKIMGKLDQDWAARRLLEYASYKDIVQQIGYARLVEYWPRWRNGIRSVSRKRGMDFLVGWLMNKHPELCHE